MLQIERIVVFKKRDRPAGNITEKRGYCRVALVSTVIQLQPVVLVGIELGTLSNFTSARPGTLHELVLELSLVA